MKEIENKIKTFDYMLILVTCDTIEISKRLNIRGEDYLKPEHYQIEYDNFIDFTKEQTLPYITLDTTNKNQKQTFEYASYYISMMKKLYESNKFKDYYPTGKIDTDNFFKHYFY